DSAGTPLGKTPPGAFFELVGEMVAGGFHPISLLACLKHPLCGPVDDLPRAKFRRAVRTLEAGLLRGARPASGLEGLEDAFRVLNRDEHKIKMLGAMGMDTDAIRDVLLLLKDACGEFIDALIAEKPDPEKIIKAHAKAAVMLCGGSENPQHTRLWHGDAGIALGEFIGSLAIEINTLGAINAVDYPALINALISARAVRLQSGAHPRVFIWGLLEARLQRSDVTILGGLNEGTWPGEAKPSPWMSRPMQKQFGLPLPERRIGLAAHDFCQAFAGPEVFITRSERVDGTPQVPSRWLVRLETMLEGAGLMGALEPDSGHSWAEWVGELSKTEKQQDPAKWEPKPRPDAKLRPKKLSVTEIETLIRDPYAIYARHILKLNPLDDIDADPGAADRGIIVHDALERFIAENMKSLPDNALARLLEIGDMSFKENLSAPTVHAFWWPRFERIAHWFLEREQKARANGQMPSAIEQRGQIKIDGLSGEFILSARVDRIDADKTGGLIIIDYKTGTPPTTPQVEAGFSPQLPLEAAMAKMGAFADVKKGAAISGLLYLQLSGGREAGTEKPIKLDSEQAASDALGGLSKLLQRFENEKTPYLSRPRPMWENRFSDYDHLARVKEWSGSGEGDA
ncbi:MAG: double-strand break repair protein AddB, partial [Rhodospirillaceae bacterium]|nr:double-strand break repair protein AddB [Rhodospirillaceae bacterium]